MPLENYMKADGVNEQCDLREHLLMQLSSLEQHDMTKQYHVINKCIYEMIRNNEFLTLDTVVEQCNQYYIVQDRASQGKIIPERVRSHIGGESDHTTSTFQINSRLSSSGWRLKLGKSTCKAFLTDKRGSHELDLNSTQSETKKEDSMSPEYDSEKEGFTLSKKDLYDYFRIKQFFFSKEILTRYFLSLKTKPFVILTGISGTGKTKIAQIFADYICQGDTPEERGKRIAFVPVKPDWMDNKGMLGYYNLLDEKYHVTPVLRLLLEAKDHPGKPYFIILDEMNLAKVEQYFSDFLSIMESRTQDRPQGEALHLHSRENVQAQDGKGDVPPSFHIPANVYFTGTVNIDESTYMFSSKVLDRANVIEFNDVNLADYKNGGDSSGRFVLKDADVRNRLLSGETFSSKSDYLAALEISSDVHGYLDELLNILRKYHLHFGYRVINEIAHFIRNTHELIQNFNLDEVMDIQILQKILPKFHGTQGKLEKPLNVLFDFCNAEDTRFPRSAQKLERMIQNLSVQGYTSFIE